MCGATAALAGVLLLGARKGKYSADGEVMRFPVPICLCAIGMFILWMGWFGFNGGSELMVLHSREANAVSDVFVNTNAAAAGGLIAALLAASSVRQG